MKVVAWLAHYLETREIVIATVDRIRKKMTGHQFVICETPGEIEREIVDADAMFCYRFTPGLLSISKQLEWIQFGSAGIDPLEHGTDAEGTTMSAHVRLRNADQLCDAAVGETLALQRAHAR